MQQEYGEGIIINVYVCRVKNLKVLFSLVATNQKQINNEIKEQIIEWI